MGNKVIVLGAGIAGLTASIHLLEKGYQVTLIEQNEEVGGLCFGYFVDGHYIDACFHWLMGTSRRSGLYKEWAHIGALGRGIKTIPLPKLGTFEYEGTTVTFYRNLDKTEKELIKISPEDKHAINKFIGACKDMGSIMGLLLKNKGLKPEEVIRALPHSAHILRCMNESREAYSRRFKHPAIRFAIKNAQTGYNNMFFFLDFYGLFASGNADVPEGGAYYFGQRIKQKFLSLGGELLTSTHVEEILMEKRKVIGVKTDKGTFYGDDFISTIDPLYTMRTLLKGEHRVWLFDHLESTVAKRPISSCFDVFLAVDGDTTKIDVPTIFQTKPMKVGAHEVDAMLVRPYHFDPKHFIKDGKTTVSLFIDQNQDDYAYFKSLSPEQYQAEAAATAQRMVDAFKERYPEFADRIRVLSNFSPIELEALTNTSFGSIQSYSFTDTGMFYIHNGKLKDIDNLYLCGQWTRAIGGTPTALLTAVEIAKQFKKGGKHEPKELLKGKLSHFVSFRRRKGSSGR